jgi:hypothetical protein
MGEFSTDQDGGEKINLQVPVSKCFDLNDLKLFHGGRA